jgi:hypothetical protein
VLVRRAHGSRLRHHAGRRPLTSARRQTLKSSERHRVAFESTDEGFECVAFVFEHLFARQQLPHIGSNDHRALVVDDSVGRPLGFPIEGLLVVFSSLH